MVACVIGDGEAETGPLATAWHSNKFLNAATDGAVLPILYNSDTNCFTFPMTSRIYKKYITYILSMLHHRPVYRIPIVFHKPAVYNI
jgi:xylulose-5-phosphate/fructose-6-phosphate phosphoketolase